MEIIYAPCKNTLLYVGYLNLINIDLSDENMNEIIGFINLKYGKGRLVGIFFVPYMHEIYTPLLTFSLLLLVTGCNPNDLDIWTDWCRLGLQFVVYKSAEQEWSFIN